jgi:hypothetical protein
MSRKQKAINYFLPAVFGNWGKFMKTLMGFSEQSYADNQALKFGLSKGLPTIDILDLVPDLNETVSSFSFLDGTSRVVDIALLKGLARRFNGQCDYMEIGSWRGESLVNISPLCREVVSVTLSKEEMKAMGFNPRMAMMDGYFLSSETNIRRIGHNSLTFDFNSLGKKFDLIFVDGDHTYDAVKSDTINAFKMLKDENSIIVFHDCGLTYEDQRNEVIGAIVEGATEEQRKHLYRVSNSLCGIYINGAQKTSYPEMVAEPNKTFEVTVKAKKFSR